MDKSENQQGQNEEIINGAINKLAELHIKQMNAEDELSSLQLAYDKLKQSLPRNRDKVQCVKRMLEFKDKILKTWKERNSLIGAIDGVEAELILAHETSPIWS